MFVVSLLKSSNLRLAWYEPSGIATLGMGEEEKTEEHKIEHVIKTYAGVSKKVCGPQYPCLRRIELTGCPTLHFLAVGVVFLAGLRALQSP